MSEMTDLNTQIDQMSQLELATLVKSNIWFITAEHIGSSKAKVCMQQSEISLEKHRKELEHALGYLVQADEIMASDEAHKKYVPVMQAAFEHFSNAEAYFSEFVKLRDRGWQLMHPEMEVSDETKD